MTDATTAPSSSNASPTGTSLLNDPTRVVMAKKGGIYHLNKSPLEVIMQMPLPGVVIFVHGVNSDGEWYSETEEGLCDGLNDRLRRRDENLKFGGVAAGQLKPITFMPELTADGFINPDMEADTFIQNDDTFSPVIRFRWGYKASGEELQKYGAGIYLNEENYWGGGPFANGCTALPDLWGEGLSDNLFLWLHVQHMNPTERLVYTCPPRPYFVLAALRLARLVESLRKKQADVPITIVCHSQGNMIGMAAAFLGDRLPAASDPAGGSGRCVADNYVLCNAPYSLVDKNGTENWSEGGMTDAEGRSGRQTGTARAQTLAAFFDIVGDQRAREQDAKRIDDRMANVAHGFTAQKDRERHGYNGSTHGRVTLYCNPQDQVISSTTVQGIGWRGMSKTEIAATKGNGVFTQRVFAQGYEVGKRGAYHYWNDHHSKPKPGSPDFWYPNSPPAEYSLTKGLDGNTTVVGQILTILTWPIFKLATRLLPTRINALPDTNWNIPLDAPDLPNTFTPKAKRLGPESEAFDEGCDAPGESRDKNRAHGAGAPYAGDHRLGADGGKDAAAERTDAAAGNKESEAALRYDDHARLRMQARREGLYKNDAKVTEEDKPETASPGYTAWRSEKIKMNLAAGVDYHATDHSTIMTNAMHACKALAYDVAVGNCDISEKDLHKLRIAADWRFLDGLDPKYSAEIFLEYFQYGVCKKKSPYEWASAKNSEGARPKKIIDQRQNPKFQREGNS